MCSYKKEKYEWGRCSEQNREKKRDRERGQAAGSSHRHALLSKQLSSQGRVTAGHGGITLLANKRELLSHKAVHDSPMTLSSCNKAKAAWTYKQKANTLSIDSGQLSRGGVERSTLCRQLGLGWRAIIGMRENSGVWSYHRNYSLSWQFHQTVSAGMELLLFTKWRKTASIQRDIPITKSKWGFLSFQSIAIPCSACMSLHLLINTSTHREVSWAGAQCPERCFELN